MTERNEDFRGTMQEIASRVAIVLTGVACIALFIGCGRDSDGGASQGSSNSEVASSSEGSPDYGESSKPMGDQAAIGGADEDQSDIESADVSFSGNFAKIEGSKPGDFWYGYFQFIDDQWLITDDVPCCDL